MYQIEKLDEDNYDTWSIQMRSVLVHAEAWKVLRGQQSAADGGTGMRLILSIIHDDIEGEANAIVLFKELHNFSLCLENQKRDASTQWASKKRVALQAAAWFVDDRRLRYAQLYK